MDYLKFIAETIHSVVAATTDDEGLPVTCALDIMDADENGLYFLTAKGKGLYRRLVNRKYIAITGLSGHDTLSSKAVSLRGNVREMGSSPLEHLINKNPYMEKIYPTAESRKALTVFQIYKGCGEWFDLSKRPIERKTFCFNETAVQHGYFIGNKCNGCRSCFYVCPQNCIDFEDGFAVIRQENCLCCGNCMEACKAGAVVRL